MPLSPGQHGDIEPPDEVMTEAVKGFLAGAFRFGSVSILAHMILIMPHPFAFNKAGPPSSQATHPGNSSAARPSSSRFSRASIQSRLFHRPLEGFSEWISPTARLYRGLTPQFKVFLQIAAMTLGGSIWAERRVNDYIVLMRKTKRAERMQSERVRRWE